MFNSDTNQLIQGLKEGIKAGNEKCYICGGTAYYIVQRSRTYAPCCSPKSKLCSDYKKWDHERRVQLYKDNPEYREKQREVGYRNHNRPDVKAKKSESMKKLHTTDLNFKQNYLNGIAHAKITKSDPEWKAMWSEKMKNKYKDPAYRRKYHQSMITEYNAAEQKIHELLNALFPGLFYYNYRSTKFRVDNLRPDFFTLSPNYLLIDYFGCYRHDQNCKKLGQTRKEYEQDRTARLSRCGYKVLYIWYEEVNDIPVLVKKIIEFVSQNKVN